jgi:hypothetical protein
MAIQLTTVLNVIPRNHHLDIPFSGHTFESPRVSHSSNILLPHAKVTVKDTPSARSRTQPDELWSWMGNHMYACSEVYGNIRILVLLPSRGTPL